MSDLVKYLIECIDDELDRAQSETERIDALERFEKHWTRLKQELQKPV